MRVLLADRNNDIRSALRLLLQETVGPLSLDEARNTAELERQIEQCVDLLIVDWELAVNSPNRVLLRLRQRNPSASVVVLGSTPEIRRSALEAGADYFINKAEPPGHLIRILNDFQPRRH
jgi:DNA-binding NarL/FixJ family response regulator